MLLLQKKLKIQRAQLNIYIESVKKSRLRSSLTIEFRIIILIPTTRNNKISNSSTSHNENKIVSHECWVNKRRTGQQGVKYDNSLILIDEKTTNKKIEITIKVIKYYKQQK